MPYETLVATIPGTDPSAGDIVFSCHLDHEKPGANDNASGCAANLEIARTLEVADRREADSAAGADDSLHLAVGDDRHHRLPVEVSGDRVAHSRRRASGHGRRRSVRHQVDPARHAFAVVDRHRHRRRRGDVRALRHRRRDARGRRRRDGARDPLAGGSKDAFWADITPYESGSDHWIYQEGAFRIPSIYLRDHPDVYIHTTGDVADNIEPTKIKRSAFIAAASGYYLATMPDHGASLLRLSYANAHERLAEDGRRAVGDGRGRARRDAANIVAQALLREQRRLRSLSRFVDLDGDSARLGDCRAARRGLADAAKGMLSSIPAELGGSSPPFRLATDTRVPVRNPDVKGPLAPDGDWVMEKAGAAAAADRASRACRTAATSPTKSSTSSTASRTVGEIRDAVSAEFEPIELGGGRRVPRSAREGRRDHVQTMSLPRVIALVSSGAES